MISKEALENVKIAPSFMGGNPRYWAYSESSIPFLEDINTIKKDLDRLEKLEKAIEIILKYKIRPSTFVFTIKNYREMYGKDLTLEKAYILLDFCGTQEEYKLLKEVLENE